MIETRRDHPPVTCQRKRCRQRATWRTGEYDVYGVSNWHGACDSHVRTVSLVARIRLVAARVRSLFA